MILKKNTKISLDKFIEKALYDKSKGYYTNKNPIGQKGDFITSPNISVMFSEMITIWLISFWQNLGCPKKINIVELGGGNGEMINQIIKTANSFDEFRKSTKFYIHEKSAKLICNLSKYLALNAQVNAANVGYHSMRNYKNIDCVIINEKEIRHEMRSKSDAIENLMKKLTANIFL